LIILPRRDGQIVISEVFPEVVEMLDLMRLQGLRLMKYQSLLIPLAVSDKAICLTWSKLDGSLAEKLGEGFI
jgi:hypothetical protein